MVALIDKIMKRFAGVAGIIADKGNPNTMICKFLEDFSGKSCTEDKEFPLYGIVNEIFPDTLLCISHLCCTAMLQFGQTHAVA